MLNTTPRLLGAILAIAVVALACVTINVYFPEEQVKDLSEQIEEAVAREAQSEDAPAADNDPTTSEDGDQGQQVRLPVAQRLWSTIAATALRLSAPQTLADEVAAPEITNPAIRRIIDSRAARLNELNGFKARGVIGENNQALVEVRDLSALALQERAAVQKLVRDENDDRERMFKEIAAATGTDLSQLPRIRDTYAATLRANARRGDLVETPDGTWKKM